jgi:uncharacterized protein YgbK (DUF1537 family)
MDGDFDPTFVAAHIGAIASRSLRESDALMHDLARRSWPGGSADRSEPAALEWVRRWGPGRLTASPLDCSCAQGRCAVCN